MIDFKLISQNYYRIIKGFDCGNLQINHYLKLGAYIDTLEFNAATSLVLKNDELVAFFTINGDYFVDVVNPETNIIEKIHAVEVQYIGVSRKFQNKGIGKEIIKHLSKICREMNSRFIFLQSVIDSVGFYEKMGFELIEKERNYCSLVLDLMDTDLIQSYYEC